LRNCLFIERNKNTSATPIAATIRKQSTPVSTFAPVLADDDAARPASATAVKGLLLPSLSGYPHCRSLVCRNPLRADAREQVVFRKFAVDQGPS
jgi:hypothetical protein